MYDLDLLLDGLPGQLMLIIALIVGDVILRFAAALRSKDFDLLKVAGFYRTMVLPMLVGYLGLSVIVRFAAPQAEWLGEYKALVSDGIQNFALYAIVATLGRSIVGNLAALFPGLPDLLKKSTV